MPAVAHAWIKVIKIALSYFLINRVHVDQSPVKIGPGILEISQNKQKIEKNIILLYVFI